MSKNRINKAKTDAREKERIEQARFKADWDAWVEADDRQKQMAKILTQIRAATVADWDAWLDGYLSFGGKITNVYDYPFSGHLWFVATKDFSITECSGAHAIHIIVPEGIEASGKESIAHSGIYLMDGFTHWSSFIPLYSDQ